MSVTREVVEAAIIRTPQGDPEVPIRWFGEHRDELRIIDVREPHELEGPLGAIEKAENIPLLETLSLARSLADGEPVVLICRSGRRSSLAAAAIRDLGGCACSVEGGMIAYNLDVIGSTDIIETERAASTTKLNDAVYQTNGLPEVSAAWVNANIGSFRLVDVREDGEVRDMGKVAQSEHIPLAQFMHKANELDREAPIVVMCASGGRSGRVVQALAGAGFKACASLEGGIFGWRAQGLPIAHMK